LRWSFICWLTSYFLHRVWRLLPNIRSLGWVDIEWGRGAGARALRGTRTFAQFLLWETTLSTVQTRISGLVFLFKWRHNRLPYFTFLIV
jgi:hypothetical protein